MSDSGTQHQPKRRLGSGFTLAVTVGGIIGLGILRTPGEIAEVVSNPVMFVSLWVVGGLFALLSAIVVAELVGMTPRSGGTYALVRRAYGPFPGFVIGWVDWLSFVADIALKAVVITEFAAVLIPQTAQWQTSLAIMVSSMFAALQLRSVTLGARIQEIAAGIMALIVVGFSLALVFGESAASSGAASNPEPGSRLSAWSLVIASIIYAYDGWSYASYFTGEVKQGSGAVARACIKGVVIIIPLYVFLVAALAWKVPLASLAGSELALASALEMVVSPVASTVVLVAAILILLAHQNLLYMSTPRVLQALAVDGLAIRRAGEISKGGNPIFAVLLTWLLSVGLILFGQFNFQGFTIGGFTIQKDLTVFGFLLLLSVFFYMFIYVVLIAGVITLRLRQPDTDRPYRAWGHPWSTCTCLLVWLFIGAYQAWAEINTAAYAAILIAISWPVYWYLTRAKST